MAKAKYAIGDKVFFDKSVFLIEEVTEADYKVECLSGDSELEAIAIGTKGLRKKADKASSKSSGEKSEKKPKAKKIKKAKPPKYEIGTLFSYENDLLYLASIIPSELISEPATYEVVSIRTGETYKLPCDRKGFSKKKPTKDSTYAKNFWLGRLQRPSPSRIGELPPGIEFPNKENVAQLVAASEIGFDIETYGVNDHQGGLKPREGRIRLLQAYLPDEDKTLIWDLGGIDNHVENYESLLGFKELRAKLACRKTKIYIHNASFESAWVAEKFNRPINNVVDSMILSQIYWAGLFNAFLRSGFESPHSLSSVHLRLFGRWMDKTYQSYDYGLELGYDQYQYAADDAVAAFRCGQKLLDMCYAEGLHATVVAELHAIPAFAALNHSGVPVDLDMLWKLKGEYEEAAAKVKTKLVDCWGEFVDSKEDLKPKLERALNIEIPQIKNEKGKWVDSVAIDVLWKFALEEKNAILKDLFLWRSLLKDVTYIMGYINAAIKVDGITVVPPNYIQNAPKSSGRTSSSAPNVQNIPKTEDEDPKTLLGLRNIRTAFRAPKNARFGQTVFGVVDFAASHEAICREASDEDNLKEAAATGTKFHFFTMRGFAALEGIEITPAELARARSDKDHWLYAKANAWYKPCKIVFYAGLNLSGKDTLSLNFGKKSFMDVPPEVCAEYNKGMAVAYPKLDAYKRKQIDLANDEYRERTFSFPDYDNNTVIRVQNAGGGYIFGEARCMAPVGSGLKHGGRLFLSKHHKKTYQGRTTFEVKAADAVSFSWVRAEANIAKMCLGDIVNYLRYGRLANGDRIRGRLSEFTHDEVGIIVNEDQAPEVMDYVNRLMERRFREYSPTYNCETYDTNKLIGSSWGDVH